MVSPTPICLWWVQLHRLVSPERSEHGFASLAFPPLPLRETNVFLFSFFLFFFLLLLLRGKGATYLSSLGKSRLYSVKPVKKKRGEILDENAV